MSEKGRFFSLHERGMSFPNNNNREVSAKNLFGRTASAKCLTEVQYITCYH